MATPALESFEAELESTLEDALQQVVSSSPLNNKNNAQEQATHVGGKDNNHKDSSSTTTTIANQESWQWPASRTGQERYTKSLRLSQEQLNAAKQTIQQIVGICQEQTELDADRIAVCGSLGCGTASLSCLEVDLVVCIDWFTVEDLSTADDMVDALQAALKERFPKESCLRTKYPSSMLVFHNLLGIHKITLSIGLPKIEPTDFLTAHAADQKLCQALAPSAGPVLAKFIKKQPDLHHILARVLYDWRDSYRWKKDKPPGSALFNVVLLQAFCQHRLASPVTGKIHHKQAFPRFSTKILMTVFEIIASVFPDSESASNNTDNKLLIHFAPFYAKEDIPSSILQEDNVIVMDPTNPTRNLWKTELPDDDDNAVELFVTRARETLEQLRTSMGKGQQNKGVENKKN